VNLFLQVVWTTGDSFSNKGRCVYAYTASPFALFKFNARDISGWLRWVSTASGSSNPASSNSVEDAASAGDDDYNEPGETRDADEGGLYTGVMSTSGAWGRTSTRGRSACRRCRRVFWISSSFQTTDDLRVPSVLNGPSRRRYPRALHSNHGPLIVSYVKTAMMERGCFSRSIPRPGRTTACPARVSQSSM